ncbi:dTDP-4-amino-4,6-dideoxy-D-glucose acetyltransferase VioB [Marinobacter nanhaiticus D15-8W]|uniref:Acyltransferase n=1 Tax=Marinobacter nanhaiticus D15-8W TaxID=626887 RepID=N6WX58_9GAMM|nr:acyltransferase [Marinobacter nanhaiticus]ENO13413.2 acyltransferase [Marinobacter nanhaiticus D15-8W]BES70780.1 dTDP-4-amino-4,6-dideoxy-D-glucose acetyltransferase VioB [Marinobacter nanhaiticus D15-8W]
MAFLACDQLKSIGFSELGNNVLISDKASIYNPENIKIGSNVRIDDYCVLSAGDGGIFIGNYVHIAVFSLLIGAGSIHLDDFSGLSSRVAVYSSNDDYSGGSLTNPTVPDQFKRVKVSNVYIGKHVIIGSGAVVLPGVTINKGAAVGSLSLVVKDCQEFKIYSGVPAKPIKNRSRNIENLEKELLSLS